MIKRILLFILWVNFLNFIFSWLLGCTAQTQQPTTTVVNYYITQTDNSQTIQGENIKADSKPIVTNKPVNEVKPDMTTKAENTQKSGIWIYWTLLTLGLLILGWFIYRKYWPT